jgi:hypothetical protein
VRSYQLEELMCTISFLMIDILPVAVRSLVDPHVDLQLVCVLVDLLGPLRYMHGRFRSVEFVTVD